MQSSGESPSRLGRYELRAKIGEGGMALVHVGRSDDGRPVALKVIKEAYCTNPDFVSMFLDEAKIVLRLAHPNAVRVYELGDERGRLFLAMELLVGQSLWHVWNACRTRAVRLRYDVIAWIGANIAAGLHHAHELTDESGVHLGLVHRDVNASNVIVTYDGRVKVIDFGLAKALNRVSKTAAGIVKGKLSYMSPEQTVGKPLDRRTDVFALGTSLWELAVDRRLFKGKDDTDTLRRVHAAKVPDPRSLVEGFPDGFADVLLKSLAREREARYASASDFSDALFGYVRSVDGGADQGMVADIMRALFAEELRRHQSWIEDASAAVATPRMDPLRPPESTMAAIDEMPIVPPPVAPALDRTLPLPGAVPRGAMPRAIEPANPPQKQADPSPAPSSNAPRGVPAKSASAAGKSGSPVVLVILMLIALSLGSVAFYLYRSKHVK